MPNVSQQYAVLIASPSDLPEERQAAKQAIWDWNDLHAEAEGVTLLPKMWETHATPAFGDRPQGIINEQLVKNADLLIGMFWTKIGTSTGAAVSGTAEEIDQIVAAGKPAMLYFSTRAIDPTKIDVKQLKGLKAFKQETYKRALVGSFAWSPSQDKLSPQRPDLDLYQYDLGIEGRLNNLTEGSSIATRPYAVIGGGGRTYSLRNVANADAQTDPLGYGAIGLDLNHAGGKIGLRFEARDNVTGFKGFRGELADRKTRNDLQFSAGVTFGF